MQHNKDIKYAAIRKTDHPAKIIVVYNVWVVPDGMENAVKERLLRAERCLAILLWGMLRRLKCGWLL